ncbi:MAG: motility associated factor glycosyltransferase family protein [Nitrospinaceae bacterium]
MNQLFEKNIRAFQSRTPVAGDLASTLSDHLTVRTARSGDVTLQYNRILIHSAYDPVKEGRGFAKKVRPGSRICLYGFGLGYHVGPILDRLGPDGFLLVIELNPDLLSAAMILKDQTAILGHSRFHLIFGRDEMQVSREISRYMERLTDAPDSPLEVLFHSPSFQCLPPEFPSLANALEILLMERRFPAVLGDLEELNLAFNREIAAKSPGINSLKGIHRSQPGVLVSAGPSLDDVLPHLRRIAKYALVGCVDTALPILTREGLVPQYIFSLDPQEESFRYFIGNLDVPAKLIFTPTANTKILHCYRGEKFVVFKESPSPGPAPLSQAREKGTTASGGSVACLGLDCLIQLGCNPIILAGQDCAYTGQRNYSSHSDNNRLLLDGVQHGKTLGKAHLEKARLKKQIGVEGTFGTQVLTDQSMYSYKRTLEQIACIHPQSKIYNLCSHGAEIEHLLPLGSVNELQRILENARPPAHCP